MQHTNGAFHGIWIGSLIKLGQKELGPIQAFTAGAAEIGLGQWKMLKFSKKIHFLNTAYDCNLCIQENRIYCAQKK